MTTAEDVFCLYERNSVYYSDCYKNGKIETCPNNWCNECYCYTINKIKPFTIGDQSVPCNIKRKCYVKQGEECPICMDKILRKCDTYLTSCGHSFHKKCIFKIVELKWSYKYGSQVKCPMCRTSIGTDIHEIDERYSYKPGTLDELENFWIKKDYILPEICRLGYNHSLGFKNDCISCINYRQKGH
jgi:Ring finger domain